MTRYPSPGNPGRQQGGPLASASMRSVSGRPAKDKTLGKGREQHERA